MDKTGLAEIREEIDVLDAQIRALLLARARLVQHVARNKADAPETMALRPAREMQQMQALTDWHASEKPPFGLSSLLAVWREIIGAALVQQGGLIVHVCAATARMARDHFGVAAQYQTHDSAADAVRACDSDPRSVAVILLETDFTPAGAAGVFALLPILEKPVALCYGAVSFEPSETMVTLVRAPVSQAQNVEGGVIMAQYGQDALIEIGSSWSGPLRVPLRADEIADKYGEAVVWLGNYDLLHVPDGQEKCS